MFEQQQKNNSFEEIWEALMEAESVLIPLHLNPDPDSYCSAIASARILSDTGKEVTVVSADEHPNFDLVKEVYPVTITDPIDLDLNKYDTFLAQDIASVKRYSKDENFSLPDSMRIVNIDHHKTNTYFGNYNYVDSEASSTAEILVSLFIALDISITQELANALFMAHISDAGWFAYGPRPEAYDVAKYLVEKGAQSRKIKVELEAISLKDVKLTGVVHSRAIYDEDQEYIYSYLAYNDYVALDMVDQQSYSGIQQFKTVNDCCYELVWVAQEQKPGDWKISFRTRESGDFDVSKLAAILGGGGHFMAAGCNIEAETIEGVKKTIDNALRKV